MFNPLNTLVPTAFTQLSTESFRTAMSETQLLILEPHHPRYEPNTTIFQMSHTNVVDNKWEFRYKTLPRQQTLAEDINLYSTQGELHSILYPALIELNRTNREQKEEWYKDNMHHSETSHATVTFSDKRLTKAEYVYAPELMKQKEKLSFSESTNRFLNPHTKLNDRITAGLQLSLNTTSEYHDEKLRPLTRNWEGSLFRYYFQSAHAKGIATGKNTEPPLEHFENDTIYQMAVEIFNNEDLYYVPVSIVHSSLIQWFKETIENHPLTLLQKPTDMDSLLGDLLTTI